MKIKQFSIDIVFFCVIPEYTYNVSSVLVPLIKNFSNRINIMIISIKYFEYLLSMANISLFTIYMKLNHSQSIFRSYKNQLTYFSSMFYLYTP